MINPRLFARLMNLPEAIRTDLLEFLGMTPVADAHLAEMIDNFAERLGVDRREFVAAELS